VCKELTAKVLPTSALETPEEENNVALAGGFNVVEAPLRGKLAPFQRAEVPVDQTMGSTSAVPSVVGQDMPWM